MSKIGAVSSTGCEKRWEMERADVEGRVWQCQETMCRIISDKLGTADILIISFIANDMFDVIAHAFEPAFAVLRVKHGDWAAFVEPKTTKQIAYIGWYDSHPMRKLIETGIIGKKSVLLLMGKDKDFNFYRKERLCINIWMNCEGDLGLQFPECDRWHTVIHTPMGVVDKNVEFEKGKDDCACGYKGATFKAADKPK